MRLWHKRLAPWFAAILLLIALTGLGIELTDLAERKAPAPPAGHLARPAAEAFTAAGLPGPACTPAKPRRTPLGEWNHWLKQVHAGKVAGPVGAALNLAGGAALLFFAGSGLWMYLQMGLRRRRARLR